MTLNDIVRLEKFLEEDELNKVRLVNDEDNDDCFVLHLKHEKHDFLLKLKVDMTQLQMPSLLQH